MPMDWKEVWKLANDLATAPSPNAAPEASHRSAVSRAYYAAFCHARNHAERVQKYQRQRMFVGGQWSQGNDHGALPSHYLKRGMSDIADPLKRLREWRNLCDYEDEVPGLVNLVTEGLAEAKGLLNRLTFPPDQKLP